MRLLTPPARRRGRAGRLGVWGRRGLRRARPAACGPATERWRPPACLPIAAGSGWRAASPRARSGRGSAAGAPAAGAGTWALLPAQPPLCGSPDGPGTAVPSPEHPLRLCHAPRPCRERPPERERGEVEEGERRGERYERRDSRGGGDRDRAERDRGSDYRSRDRSRSRWERRPAWQSCLRGRCLAEWLRPVGRWRGAAGCCQPRGAAPHPPLCCFTCWSPLASRRDRDCRRSDSTGTRAGWAPLNSCPLLTRCRRSAQPPSCPAGTATTGGRAGQSGTSATTGSATARAGGRCPGWLAGRAEARRLGPPCLRLPSQAPTLVAWHPNPPLLPSTIAAATGTMTPSGGASGTCSRGARPSGCMPPLPLLGSCHCCACRSLCNAATGWGGCTVLGSVGTGL